MTLKHLNYLVPLAICAAALLGCHSQSSPQSASASLTADGTLDAGPEGRGPTNASDEDQHEGTRDMTNNSAHIAKTDEEWRKLLTPMQYKVTREKGTERAFTGEYWDNKADGIYQCVCCGEPMFDSETKYESGTGWPSFYQPYSEANIKTEEDNGWFSSRTEVLCKKCDAHLGHVFPDGPQPTGLRYCMNSAALKFVERDESEGAADRQVDASDKK